jgi:hypothetical protein
MQRGRVVVAVGDQAPDEAGGLVGELVHGVDRVREIREVRVVQGLLQPRHIELGEVVVHGSPRSAPVCSSAQMWLVSADVARQRSCDSASRNWLSSR